MPHYVVSSEGPIRVRELERPDLPDWRPETGLPGVPDTGGPGRPSFPEFPGFPERPGHPIYPVLPSRDDLIDMLPPGLKPGVGLPIPPTPEHPWVPVPPNPEEPEVWPPPGVIWPPVRPELPGMPDMTGKSLVLALLYVSRHAPRWGYVVVDHDAAKGFVQKVKDWVRHAVGRPPARPTPGG